MTDVISIQSQVVHGHVGNSAAVFPLQASGLTVAAIPTVLLSNHPRYPSVHGRTLDADLVAALLRGVEDRGLVETARVILTGYLASIDNGAVVADFVRRALACNPRLIFACDPVMGDADLGIFVDERLIGVFQDDLVPLASVITPNQFELGLLAGREVRSESAVIDAVKALARHGAFAAAVTGCVLDDSRPGTLETVVWQDGAIHRFAVDRLSIRPCGTGDLFAALLVAGLCSGADVASAAARATEDIHAVLRRTSADGTEEMRIVGFPFRQVTTP